MSATVRIRVDLADLPTVEVRAFTGPSLQVERTVRVGDTLEHIGTTVRLEAESLEDLRDWLADAAEDVQREIVKKIHTRYGEPDTDAAAADAGALA